MPSRLPTLACFGLSVVLFIFAGTADGLGVSDGIRELVGFAAAGLFVLSTLVALYRALRGIVRLIRPPGVDADPAEIPAILGNLLMAGLGALVTYVATTGFARGRQVRRLGRVLLPGLRPDDAWTKATMLLDGGEVAPTGLADRWRENGKTEHASVAAFARLTLDLMALGAPPSLIAAANEDALDEIRHTELCFSLAQALDGRRIGPAPFPQAQRVARLPRARKVALAKLAVDSLVDGAMNEGVSARIIAKLAHRCEVPAIRSALKEIASDEGRHAAHGWAVVAWCMAEGGSSVSAALQGALRVLPKEMNSQLPESAMGGAWERWGVQGQVLEAAEYAAARAHVVERVETAITSASQAA